MAYFEGMRPWVTGDTRIKILTFVLVVLPFFTSQPFKIVAIVYSAVLESALTAFTAVLEAD